MFGPNLAYVRRNIVRNKPSRVDTEEYEKTPEDFYKPQKFLMLRNDAMFVNIH